jgi:hypothetical protein
MNPLTERRAEGEDGKPLHRAKRKLWRRFLIVPGLVLALGLGYCVLRSWQADSELESRLEQLREHGVPLTLDELQTPALPKDDNAETWFRQAQPHTDELSRLLKDYQSTEEFQSFRPNAEQMEMLKKAFDDHVEAFVLYARAADCSGFQSDWRIGARPSESLKLHLVNTSVARSIMRHCSARAGLLMAEGDFDEALKMGLQMLKLSRSVDHQPMVLGYLVGLACRSMSLDVIVAVLEQSPLTEEQRQQIDSALADCESVSGFTHALASERIYGLATFRSDIFGGPMQSLVTWHFKFDACDYLDLIDEMSEWAPQPRHAIVDELNSVTARKHGLTAMVATAIQQIRMDHDRLLANVRCVRLLNALQRNYANGIPGEPVLNELPGNQESRTDPFSGAPLKVRVTDEFIVVYSVGANGTDDGGNLDDHEDEGIQIELDEAGLLQN